MATALIYALSSDTRDRLNEQLLAACYTVDSVAEVDEVAAILKREARDVIITEVRKDNFAFLMRLALAHNRHTIMHFFEQKNIFCFYPMQKQPSKLVNAISQAGLLLSARLLQHTERTHDAIIDDGATIEI